MRYLAILICLISTPIFPFEYELSTVAIFQNEARFLKEWIEYHRLLGVEHFWLYNNNSTDDYIKVLTPYIKSNLVELIDWPSIQEENDWQNFSFRTQVSAYTDALKRSKYKTNWLAIIDVDEFILPVHEKTITKCLNKHYYDQVAIYIKWLKFGTSHYEFVKPYELMIEKLTWRAKDDDPCNNWRKSIVRPIFMKNCTNPHFCNIASNHKRIDCPLEIMRINHYWTRDEHFLNNVKIPRYKKWGGREEKIRNDASHLNGVEDLLIQKHVKKLRHAT